MLTDHTRRDDFPSLSEIAYLNTAAEGIPPRAVGEALAAYGRDKLEGMKGREAHFAQLEACREVAARLVGLRPPEVAFCSCSSEAFNLLASALDLSAGDEVVINDLDYPAGVSPWLRAPVRPATRKWLAVEGELRVSDLEPLLNPRTRLVQASLVSFYNGHRLAWRPFRDAVRRLAPQALISLDITQALGRVPMDCDADVLVSSTHKWTLGIHGGCVVGIPEGRASRLTTHAGGWYNLQNSFDADRFDRAVPKPGAASFAVGMPNFPALYALNAALRYLEQIGVAAIAGRADPLATEVDAGLRALGFKPMCPRRKETPSGIVSWQHPRAAEIHAALLREGVHVMHQAGRLRVSVHGYNTPEDVGRLLGVLRGFQA